MIQYLLMGYYQTNISLMKMIFCLLEQEPAQEKPICIIRMMVDYSMQGS